MVRERSALAGRPLAACPLHVNFVADQVVCRSVYQRPKRGSRSIWRAWSAPILRTTAALRRLRCAPRRGGALRGPFPDPEQVVFYPCASTATGIGLRTTDDPPR